MFTESLLTILKKQQMKALTYRDQLTRIGIRCKQSFIL